MKLIKRTKKEIETLVNDLMARMTIKEKIGQMYESFYEGSAATGPEFDNSRCLQLLKEGKVGSIIGQYDNQKIYNLQRYAVEETRMKIPLLFCNDIIHGCRIAFPINLAMSCSWNPTLLQKAMRVIAYESSHSGVNLTFSPMLDLARDPRWGRVMETSGEDPYLSKEFAKAYVKGYQGNLLSKDSVAACAKHFVGYGACVGGRDYDSVDMSEDTLFQYYLPSFMGAIEANVKMIMASFNTFNGIPMTMNKYVLKDVLRKRLGFKGVIISDYTTTTECIKHKTACDLKDVALKCLNATLDHEMLGTSYINYLEELCQEGSIEEKQIEEACKRVLTLKYEIGLFDDPYKNIYIDFEKYWLKKENLRTSLKMAEESICLLKNDGALPLSKKEKVCFIGPFVKEKRVVGAWGGKTQIEDTVTIYEALEKGNYKFNYAKGCEIFSECMKDKIEALDVARQCDTVVMAVGEDQWNSGECNSKANITIPQNQENLIDEIINLGKKLILIIFAGRPLILTKYQNNVQGIVYAWFLGTMSGEAIVNTLYGKTNPSGKLTMSFPYDVGQIPVYYNHLPTGRPREKTGNNEYKIRYLDIPLEPLYSFGFGLSYSKFVYGEIVISNNTMKKDSNVQVSVTVKNDSSFDGKEIIQLYIEALYFSISRPVKELKGFKKVLIKAHETKTVEFILSYKDLQYFNKKFVNEPGKYRIYVGPSSDVDTYKEIVYEI